MMIYTNEGGGNERYHLRAGNFDAQLVIRTRAVPKSVGVAALNAGVLSHRGLQSQTKVFRRGSTGGQAPQVDGQTPGRRHYQPAFAAVADATAQLLDGRVVRLPADQP